MSAEVPPMPKGFIDPHAPDAEERLKEAMNARVTVRTKAVTIESNPGGDSWVRERFVQDEEPTERDGGHGDDR